ncbi:MAG: SIMPL domain-containing protein [Candidatus Staskawiczbacteria bacterium]|jgi:uncharacterized protein YggE
MEEQTIKFLNKSFILAAILVLGILVFFVGQMSYQNRALEQQNTYQITVSGEGKVYAKPDVAVVSLGVTTTGATVADVATSNTIKMNSVIDAVKKMGIADKDIQTTTYNLTPDYNSAQVVYNMPMMPAGNSSKIIGYTLEQDIQVKIRDFTKIGDILSVTASSGANQIGDLQFTIDNPDQYKNEAEADAIAKAKTNAQSLAKASGIQLGKLINVQVGNNYYPAAYNSPMMAGASSAAVPSPTVEPGQQEIDMTVNLIYQVK